MLLENNVLLWRTLLYILNFPKKSHQAWRCRSARNVYFSIDARDCLRSGGESQWSSPDSIKASTKTAGDGSRGFHSSPDFHAVENPRVCVCVKTTRAAISIIGRFGDFREPRKHTHVARALLSHSGRATVVVAAGYNTLRIKRRKYWWKA